MEWIVKIEKSVDNENEIAQRIRFVFDPLLEQLYVYGEAKVKNNKWFIFSQISQEMKVDLEGLQSTMELAVVDMRKRLVEYENLDNGFGVLKWVGFNE